MRATFEPCLDQAARMPSGVLLAGPSVPTILVRGVYFVATSRWAAVQAAAGGTPTISGPAREARAS